MNYGRVVVFRKGKSSAPYELEEGTHTIGSSSESNIRLKFIHPSLLDTHALIQVSKDGIASITNKSVDAPVLVNGKPIIKSTILRHEDKFEVLEKVFQYFNESLINEAEIDKKMVKEKRNLLAKSSRQSVNPLIKTPAKKSPNLKTKIPSLRKTMSDIKTVSKPRNSFQVLVTPNNRPERSNGSKTMSKIIVSKALGAPNARKRFSLDTSVTKSQSPKISSRNILLSKSTINITISEEHEYTKLTPSQSMRTIQEYDLLENNEIQTKGRTPRKSVKLEKDESMCLIGFGTPDAPAVITPDKRTPLKRQSNNKAGTTDDSNSNIMNTPVNKRIQSLKNVRHSLKKDTPPPRSSVPKIIVQAPTPQRRSSLRKTISATTSEDGDILVTFSPNAEPSTHNNSSKESTTPRKSLKKFEESGDQANKSRVSFAVEAPNENSNLDFEAMNVSEHLVNEEKAKQEHPNGSRKSTNVLNDNPELTKSRRSTRYSLSSSKKLKDPLEISVSKTFRTSVSNRKSKNQNVLLMESSEESTDVDEEFINKSNRKSSRGIIISASTDNSDGDRRSMPKSAGKKKPLSTSEDECFEGDTSSKVTENTEDYLLNKSLPEQTASESKTQKRSLRYSNNKSILSAKDDSFSYSPNVSVGYSNNTSKVSVNNDLASEDENLAEPLERSLNSSNSSRNVELNSTKSSMSDLDIDAISDRLEKSLNSLEDVSTTKNKSTSNNSKISVKSQNVDSSSCEEMDELFIDKTVYSSRSRTSAILEKSRTSQIESPIPKKSLGNNSRRSLQIQKADVTSSEDMDELCVDKTVSSRSRTSTIPEKSRTSQNMSITKKKSLSNTSKSENGQNVDANSSDEMDELSLDETAYSSMSRTSTIPEKSRTSQNVSTTSKKSLTNNRKSEKGEIADAGSSEEMDDLCVDETVYSSRTRPSTISEKSRTSLNASRVSTRSLGTSRNDVTSPQVANNSLGLSKSNSRKSFSALQDDVKETKENSFNASKKSTRLSKNASRQSNNFGSSTDLSADEGNISITTVDKDLSLEQIDANNSGKRNSRSRLLKNTSQGNIQSEVFNSSLIADQSTTEANDVSEIKLSRNNSSRGMYEKLDDSTQSDDEKESSRMSRSSSRRSTKTSNVEENNANKSRLSGNYSARSTLSKNSFKTDENSTNKKNDLNMSSRISRNSLRLSKSNLPSDVKDKTINKSRSLGGLEVENDSSSLLLVDTAGEDDNIDNNTSRRSSSFKVDESNVKSYSRRSTLPLKNSSQSINKSISSGSMGNTTDENITSNNSSRLSKNKSRNGAPGSQSSIDSAETTMDTRQIEEKEARASRSAKGRSGQSLNLFDESTQEATPAKNVSRVSRGQARQRLSIFEGSTKEALAEVSQSKSGSLVILDDTHEVLSPVRPLSPRKSIRSQVQGLEASISPSARTSSIRRSRSKSHNLQDSSLTMTSMDKSSSSMISVSSQSFSSFKKGPSKAEDTEIDVVNVSSVIDTTEVRRSVRRSGGVSSEVVAESKVLRSIQRQSLPADMFKDVSCTSTPFHKQNVSKKSRTTETIAESNSTTGSKEISRKSSRQLEMFSVSGDSVFTDSQSEQNDSVSKVGGDSGVVPRRSSSRSSILKQGEHNCISCRNSSAKRSRSASESSASRRNSSSSLINSSKTARKSSGSVLEQGYEETSPVKRNSSALVNKASPLLHRKSSVIILSESTPEKTAETEDETPKSSIKPARRSSKANQSAANQSAYNPLLEDITPVTPEKLMVSGFTEEAFKTPINTPGLFESIRKSVIRSRKRHRESTGSVMKESKRARIELPNEDQDQLLDDDTQEYVQKKPQRSPANRLSDFEGVKELMTTPPTSVATRRKSSKNDLTNVPKSRQEVDITSPRKSLKQSPLTKIASPRHKKSPRNKSVSLDGVKQLLKTPRTQKEPVNDLTNVSGVGNLFNLSGVEVLHHGSDIENSEDLFTKVTGKRPVRAYQHRGKSMSPNKQLQQEGRSRKTMGDIPICSPRVQQWVEEHANVMYAETEDGLNLPASEHDEELLKVSDRPRLKSRSGRSISPKKHIQDRSGRRKTQGDALRHTPNVEKWRDDETRRVNARKLSLVTKTEPTTPNPNQSLPMNNLKIENITPQQRKSGLKQVTPQQLTPLVKVAKVTPQSQKSTVTKLTTPQLTPLIKVAKITPQSEKSAVTQLTPQQKTPQRITVTPASVRARKNVANASSSKQTTNQELVSTSITETKRVSVSKDQEAPKQDSNTLVEPPKRGGHTKRIRSNEELDIVTSTTDSPNQGSQIRETRSRRVITEDVKTKTTAKGKRSQKVIDKQESIEQSHTKELVIQIKEIDYNLPAARGRRGQKTKELDIINIELSKEEQNVKPKSRGGRGKKADEQNLNLQSEEQDTEVLEKPTVKGKRGKKANEDLVIQNQEPITEAPQKPVVTGKRGKKVNEDVVINIEEQDTEVLKKPNVRGKRGKKANEDLIVQDEEPSTEEQDTEVLKKQPVRRKRGKKANVENEEPSTEEQETEVLKKLPVRGKRGKKADEDLIVQNEELSTEVPKKLPVRGKRGKKETEHLIVQCEEPSTEKSETEVPKKPIVRGKRGKKANDDLIIHKEDLSTEEHDGEVLKKPTRGGRRGKKVNEDLIVQNDAPSIEEKDTEVPKKPAVRGRRGKKANEDLVEQNEKPSSEEQETEVLKKPPVRGRRGKKEQNEEPSAEEQDTQVVKKPIARGKKGKTAKEVAHSEEPVTEQLILESKVQKQPAKKTRSKKVDEKQVLDESETDFEDPEVEMQPKGKKAVAKGRGKKAVETSPETVTSKQTATKRNLRNKVIEEVKEMEVDSPRTARAKRGINKKYSTDEYEVAEMKGGSKRKVHFEDNLKGESTHAIEIDTRKSKRLRK